MNWTLKTADDVAILIVFGALFYLVGSLGFQLALAWSDETRTNRENG